MATDSLFAYGTLQVPEVLHALLGRVPDATRVTVAGWRVASLPGRVYPGLIPSIDSDGVPGIVLSDLTSADWLVIDAFEDSEYDLREVLLDDSTVAWSYVWRDVANITDSEWTLQRFVSTALPNYMHTCRSWRQRYSEECEAAVPQKPI